MAKVCTIIYIHSERGQNNYVRGYCHAINKVLREDPILADMCVKINGDDPKYQHWLSRNSLGVTAPNPGFIVKLPRCSQAPNDEGLIFLDVGFATQVFELAYAIHKIVSGEEVDDPPQIYTKPPVLETDEICALSALIQTLPAIIGKD